MRHRRFSETVLLALVLSVIAAMVYGPHAIHGGFIGDAWATRAWYLLYPHGQFFGTVGHFLNLSSMSTRPLNAVYRVALNELLGGQMGLWFAWQAASCVLMSLILYLLLRKLDFEILDAGLIVVFVLIFPAASSLRLWSPVIHASLSIALAELGFLVALYAFASGGRRRLLLHGGSLLLFVASLLLYEVALPLMLASILLYRVQVSWRQAIPRWLLDCGILIPIGLTVTRSASSTAQNQSVNGALAHAVTILEQCPTLLTTVLLPFGAVRWYVFGAIVLLAVIALLVATRLPPTDPARSQLHRWLAVLAAGLVVIILGYSIYMPGIDYYEPLAPGIADRVNAVSSIGWVLALYALFVLAATLAFRHRSYTRRLTSAAVVVACAFLGANWLRSISVDASAYTRAYREGQRTLAVVRAAVPDPKPNSTIWTFGQPVEIAPGIPVFGNTWDMTASVALMYRDRTLRSYVGFPGTTFECRSDVIVPGGNEDYPPTPSPHVGEFASSYGSTYFVDTTSGQFELIRTPKQCLRAAGLFERSLELPVG